MADQEFSHHTLALEALALGSAPQTTPTDQEFITMVHENHGALMGHAVRKLGNPEDGEDAVQEAYLSAWRSRQGFTAGTEQMAARGCTPL